MANENKTAKIHNIPLGEIHNFPGVVAPQHTDRSLGGLVSSIQSGGVKEPVILRQREDGEFELLSGYRRKRASELAKKTEIPAQVYEMPLDKAKEYFMAVRSKPDEPIPGKPVEELKKPAEPAKDDKKQETPAKPADSKATPAAPVKDDKKQEAPTKPADSKATPAAPVKDDKKQEAPAKPADSKATPAASVKDDKKQEAPAKPADGKKAAAPADPKKQETAQEKQAAQGPTGTAISKVFDPLLDSPDEKALKALPLPKEGEAFFMTLHPGYLEKSKFNNFSVDKESENYKELKKAIELAGVKDPVLARPKEDGGLEILSGQRRHTIATELNYAVPVIVQLMDDDDAKILVADSNLHRDKISSYDLSRALRMKMDAMKRKAGRRRKDDKNAPQLNTDEALAAEMGISASKFNRIIRLTEATKGVCEAYDRGEIEISIASALSFLKPKTQDTVLSMAAGGGYTLSTKRVERMKALEKDNKLDPVMINKVFQDKDIAPPPVPAAPVAQPTAQPATGNVSVVPAESGTTAPAPAPASPGEKQPESATTPAPAAAADPTPAAPAENDDLFKGEQERPEHTKVILSGDRLRKYFPDVKMTPREIEESVYDALEERRQRQEKMKAKAGIFKEKAK